VLTAAANELVSPIHDRTPVIGRKRHVLTDTLGLLLAVNVHPASVQDRDGAEALLREAR